VVLCGIGRSAQRRLILLNGSSFRSGMTIALKEKINPSVSLNNKQCEVEDGKDVKSAGAHNRGRAYRWFV
jgi:hypothetical protein